VDDRLLQNKIAKSYVANTNIISKATMSLSYCFPRDEVDAITLTLSREAAFLEEGRQWGVAQVQITLEETEFPIQTHNTVVRAINTIPQSMLEERDVDPDMIDISMGNHDLQGLRQMYLDGDLADETEPVTQKTEIVKYAKSSLAGPKGRKSDKPQAEGWEFLKDKRQQGIQAGANSVTVEDDDITEEIPRPPKSIMKRAKVSFQDPNLISPETPPDVASISSSVERPPTPPRRVVVENPGFNPVPRL